MFQSARVKLTIWYILITMIVSLLFSFAIYQSFSQELNRFERAQRLRTELQDQGFPVPPRRPVNIELLEEGRNHLQRILLSINLAILGISAAAGYFLAGRTLRPIQQMVDKQNQFITDASHELRTPLTALKTGIEVNLRDKNFNLKQAKTVLQENLTDVEKLRSLSDNLLTLSVLQHSNITAFKQIALDDVIKSSIEKVKPLAQHKHITLKSSVSKSWVKGDHSRLVDLFVIFLDNAIKYSPEKTTITIHTEKVDSVVKTSIADQGMGIHEKDIPHIFERFYRVDKSRSTVHTDGYGLGLAIAHEILTSHKGSVTVESTPDKGSTFIISLPSLKTPSV